MIIIDYINDLGKVRFGGGSTDGILWNITEITGLELPAKTLNVVTYPGQQGQHTLNAVSNARNITIKGDIRTSEGVPFKAQARKYLKILNSPGELIVRDGAAPRKIKAQCDVFEQVGRQGPYYVFVVQFICDYPFFEDYKTTTVDVFHRNNAIDKSFTLQCVFTERISKVTILNSGDTDTEPIFTIHSTGSNESQAEGELSIINHTTNQKITLEYALAYNETVKINIPKRTIYNNFGVNLIDKISDDTFLSDFWLQTGNNDIEIVDTTGLYPNAVCQYTNKYVEAVF